MLTNEELDLAKQVKAQGGSKEDAMEVIAHYRSQKQPTQAPTPAPSKPIFQDTRANEGVIEQGLKAIPRGLADTVQFGLGGAEQTARGFLNVAGRLGSTAGKAVRSGLESAGVDVPTVQGLKPWQPMKENVFSNTIGAAKEATYGDKSFGEAYKEANKADVERYGNQGVGGDLLDIGTGIRKVGVTVAAPVATGVFSTVANAPGVQYAPQALSAATMAPVNYADRKLDLGMNEGTKENIAFNLGMGLTKPFAKTKIGNSTGLTQYHKANDAVMSPIVKPVQNMGKAFVEKAGKTKEAITPNGANISTRANRFNALDEQKFIDATGETPGQFSTSRGMTKVGPKAVDEAVQKFEKSKAEADKAFEQVEGKFRYNGQGEDLVHTMVSDLDKRLTNVKSPEAPKIAQLKTKYENEGLTMPEINDLKRTYARNFKYAFQEMGSEPAMRSTNLQNALREWQFGVAKDNGLSNIAEINKNTQGWKMFADSLAKKLDRSGANNQFGLTDWIALAGGTPANIALFLGKQGLSSNFVKEGVIKAFTKQDKPDIIPASYEGIVKSNIEKQYANPSSVLPGMSSPGGESMVRPAGLLPAPSKKTLIRNQNVEVSKKILKESKAKEAVTKQPEVTTRSKIVIPKATTESALKTTPVVPEKKSIVAKKEATVKTPEIKSEKVIPKEVKTDASSVPMPKQLMDIIKTSKNQDDMVSKLREASNNSYEFRDTIRAYEKAGGKDMTYAELFGMKKSLTKPTTESAFKNNKGFINPSEIKKSLIPKKGADEARQFYDDLVYAGNSPIVAQRETAKRFGTIKAMSASKAGTFGGEGAKEAPKTGWFKGADGKMKFEIDDSKANFEFPKRTTDRSNLEYGKAKLDIADASNAEVSFMKELDGFKGTNEEFRMDLRKKGYDKLYDIKKGEYRLGDVLQHSDLYKQYPWLENTPVSFHTEGGMRSAGEMTNGKISIALNAKDPKSVILHEIQHIIQEKEGFANGSNMTGKSFNDYKRAAGEVESRNVQTRMNMTAKERALKSPRSTEDVPRSKQIVRTDNKVVPNKK